MRRVGGSCEHRLLVSPALLRRRRVPEVAVVGVEPDPLFQPMTGGTAGSVRSTVRHAPIIGGEKAHLKRAFPEPAPAVGTQMRP